MKGTHHRHALSHACSVSSASRVCWCLHVTLSALCFFFLSSCVLELYSELVCPDRQWSSGQSSWPQIQRSCSIPDATKFS
jgi:hypothetical protein